jgi:peptidoglycan DL-endopeptidase LytF
MRYAFSLALAVCLILVAHAAGAAKNVLVVGDSLSISLGEQLETYYALQQGVSFVRHGKVSSGLVRQDFYNWEHVLDDLAKRHRPDVLIVMLGTNDFKPLRVDGTSLGFGTPAWNREYARRVQRLITIARHYNQNSRIFWVGAPVMGKPELNRAVALINRVIAGQCRGTERCQFIDTGEVLADAKGRYIEAAPLTQGGIMKLRAGDGVHLTRQGAALLADHSLRTILPDSRPLLALTRATSPGAPESGANPDRLPAVVNAASPAPSPRSQERTTTTQAVAESIARGEIGSRPVTTQGGVLYVIQESSWSTRKEALRRARQLEAKGLSLRVVAADLGKKGVWHRVMIGGFDSLERAKAHKQDLSKRFALSHTIIVRSS